MPGRPGLFSFFMQVKHSRSVSQAAPPPAGPVAATRRRKKWVLLLLALAGVGIGCWYVARARSRAAERLLLLQAARDHQPDAATRIRAHLETAPDDAEALEALVEWQLWARVPFAEIEPHLDRLCALRPDDLNGFRVRARLRLQNGRPAEAVADGLRVLEGDPEDYNTRRLVAIAAGEAGNTDVAARELTRLLDALPAARQELALKLVRVHLQSGNEKEAGQALERYFAPSDESGEVLILRGRMQQSAGRHDEAIAILRRAADRSAEGREAALFHILESQRALGRDTDAARTLAELDLVKARQRLIVDARQQPDNMPVQIQAARQLLEDGKPAEAIAVLEQAMLRGGKNVEAARVLSKAYRQAGQPDRAVVWEQFADRP